MKKVTLSVKCEHCGKELQRFGGFTVAQHRTVIIDFEGLENLCFTCFGRVPTHIPYSQHKKWLREKDGKLGCEIR